MSGNESIRDTFFEECEDLLEALQEGLTAIEEGSHNDETVNAVFRAVHSIKGGAGAFGLEDLVGFAHTFETLFDEVRSGKLNLDPDLIQILLRGSDQLAGLVEAAQSGADVDAEVVAGIITELESYLDVTEEEEVEFVPMAFDFDAIGSEPEAEPEHSEFHINFRPTPALFKNGHEPLFFLQSLGKLGEIETTLEQDDIPDFGDFDPEDSYLSWTCSLKTTSTADNIQEIFEFVEGLCDLTITEVSESAPEAAPMPAPSPFEQIETAMQAELDAPPAPKPAQAAKAPAEDKATSKQESKANPTLRVDLERIDRLINSVGELIINQSMLAQRVSEIEGFDIRPVEAELEDYKLLARDLQEGIMAIRAQPVKPLFQRMARIVREAANATGKSAKLVTSGEGTEVDKTVIERLSDPLTHMIRNAVDHGLETREKRLEAGKSETGEIHLAASHQSGSVYLEIRDDGAGLNREKIYKTAIEKGLIPEGAELSERDIDHLLFMPGFSTATEVSALSGRGVGMDVVKNAVTALGGRISISSTPGQGTVFSVVLPLTMAVMDGMVVSIAGHTMVVPILSIVETIRPDHSMIHSLGPEGRLLAIRGSFVPIVDVGHNLGLRVDTDETLPDTLLLIGTKGQGQCALAVDAIHDQRQVVVKTLSGVCGAIPGVAAATILGDGKIAMILEPNAVAQSQLVDRSSTAQQHSKNEVNDERAA